MFMQAALLHWFIMLEILQAQQQQNMMQQVMQGLQVLAASPQLFSPEGQQKALPAIQAVVQQATQQNNATQTATTQPRAN